MPFQGKQTVMLRSLQYLLYFVIGPFQTYLGCHRLNNKRGCRHRDSDLGTDSREVILDEVKREAKVKYVVCVYYSWLDQIAMEFLL